MCAVPNPPSGRAYAADTITTVGEVSVASGSTWNACVCVCGCVWMSVPLGCLCVVCGRCVYMCVRVRPSVVCREGVSE